MSTPFGTARSLKRLHNMFAALNNFFSGVVVKITTYVTQKGIFGFGLNVTPFSITNLVSNTGVVATDTAGVGTPRYSLGASAYGGDKAVFAFGYDGVSGTSIANLVSNTGVVATDTATVATATNGISGTGYGGDKAIFIYVGATRVSNTGVFAATVSIAGLSSRINSAAAGYGVGTAIYAFGFASTSFSNLISNIGGVSADIACAGSARHQLSAAMYGGDKAIFGFGSLFSSGAATSITNLVSNTGVIASDTTGVGSARYALAATNYGGDKAIFSFGTLGITNLISNTGVVGADITGVGTSRANLAAANFSLT